MSLYVILFIGVILMSALMSWQVKRYYKQYWKGIIVAVLLVITGVIGSYLWFYLENGTFGGRSFYGAVFFAPILFLPASKILRMKYLDVMDLIAPAGCITLALVKVQCIKDRCCMGKVLFINADDIVVRFPSQIAEMIVFFVIAAILIWMLTKPRCRSMVFPWFLVLYGSTRFVLDFFRDVQSPYAIGLSAGSFWSLCAILLGVAWFAVLYLQKNFGENNNERKQRSKN